MERKIHTTKIVTKEGSLGAIKTYKAKKLVPNYNEIEAEEIED